MESKYISYSETETVKFAEYLGRKARRGDIFALSGEMGSGKTVFARGIALGMGIEEEICSPTFSLVEEYGRPPRLCHFDLYRIEGDGEFDNLNFEEYWNSDAVSVIEWPENAGARLPSGIIKVEIAYIDENSRSITVEYPDN